MCLISMLMSIKYTILNDLILFFKNCCLMSGDVSINKLKFFALNIAEHLVLNFFYF